MQADHAVFDCDSMDERLLVIEKVGVGDPELVSNPVVKCQVERDSHIGQALVPPILLEIHSQCVVLWIEKENTIKGGYSLLLHVIQAITSGFLSQKTADIKKQHEQLLKECGPTGSHTHSSQILSSAFALSFAVQ